MSDERDDVDAFAERDEDPAWPPYSTPAPEDEQWRRQAPPARRTGPAAGVAEVVRATVATLEAPTRVAELAATDGVVCLRCGRPTQVLIQPLGGGPRTLCGRCVGADVRRVSDQIREACRAYKSGNRGAGERLVELMGRHDAQTWMQDVDAKAAQAGGGSW